MSETTQLYARLAETYHGKGRYQERDRFFMLAADTAWTAGDPEEAEAIRRRILEFNPNHLLRPYQSFAEAIQTADMMAYIQQLRRGYPPSRAEELLRGLEGSAGPKVRTDDAAGYLPPALGVTLKPEAMPTWSTRSAEQPKFIDLPKPAPPPPPPPPRPAPLPAREPEPPPADAEPFDFKAEPIPFAPPVMKAPPAPTPIPPPAPMHLLPPSQRIATDALRYPPANEPQIRVVPEPDEPPVFAASAWVGGLMFIGLLVASLALAAYMFVRPFVNI